MSKKHCCVIGCTNGGHKIKIWKSKICVDHNSNYGSFPCTCPPPFQLYQFPKNEDDKKSWTKLVNRKDGKNPHKNWAPTGDSRVCSHHFIDGAPTQANPHPTQLLGYETKSIITPRKPPKSRLSFSEVPAKKIKQSVNEHVSDHGDSQSKDENGIIYTAVPIPSENDLDKSFLSDHSYGDFHRDCVNCETKESIINNLKLQVSRLTRELTHAKVLLKKKTEKPFGIECIKSDEKMKFYTGIPKKAAFFAIFNCIKPCLPKVQYWRAGRTLCNILPHKKLKSGRQRVLSPQDELLLTLMKLRLGLLNKDLADRFGVSEQLISNIFTTWIKLLEKFIGSLVFNPPKEVVRENLPPSFQNQTYNAVRHIIDCTEVFIETPHNLAVRADTWSDYKHHNTAKYLVSINPSGMFNYVSKGWGGRTSDKHITKHSGFLNLVEPYDKVLADRGFPIMEDLVMRNAELLIPPGRRGTEQFSKEQVVKTKQIANRRIFIEQAIRRMKYFRILKYELPMTLFHHLDEIVKVVCGLCNLSPPLPKYGT